MKSFDFAIGILGLARLQYESRLDQAEFINLDRGRLNQNMFYWTNKKNLKEFSEKLIEFIKEIDQPVQHYYQYGNEWCCCGKQYCENI